MRIPKSFAREIGLARDIPVILSLEDGRLVVEPVTEPPLTLEQLLEQVTEDIHRHTEIVDELAKKICKDLNIPLPG